jgi:predicted short-subunit dehydrogenase-like oxidoreductase (DUF2520 family)
MNLAFIGPGNLAWHLAPELENSGHSVKIISGRSKKNLQLLAERLYDPVIREGFDFSQENIQMVFLTTPDSAIRDVVSEIILPDDCVLVHCSASISLDVLEPAACPATGVFYLLQTFTRGYKIDFSQVPVLLEASSEETGNILAKMAKGISKDVYFIDSDLRKKLHLAATFACNFNNHMLTIARDLVDEYELDFDLLWPILKTTIQKAMELGPENAQTGPAVRCDYDTMDAHMELLEKDPELEEIYSLISKHIMKRHGSEN